MFEKKTKWQVLVTYNQNGNDYIVFARKGLKSGMIYFKTKNITPTLSSSYNFNPTLFDLKKNFDEILYAFE
jgi:hypothetical protein